MDNLNDKQLEKMKLTIKNYQHFELYLHEIVKKIDLSYGNANKIMIDYILACYEFIELKYNGYLLMLDSYKKDDSNEYKANFKDNYKKANDNYIMLHDKTKSILDGLQELFKEIESISTFQMPSKDKAA